MSLITPTVGAITLSGANLTYVVIVALISLGALVVAGFLVREVLAAGEGTDKMQEIAKAVLALLDSDFLTGETIRVDGGRHLR